MATLVKEVYEAFLIAGVDKETASKAAGVFENYMRKDEGIVSDKDTVKRIEQIESRLDQVEARLGNIEFQLTQVDNRLVRLETQVTMLMWMIGGIGGGVLLLLLQNFIV